MLSVEVLKVLLNFLTSSIETAPIRIWLKRKGITMTWYVTGDPWVSVESHEPIFIQTEAVKSETGDMIRKRS